MAHIPPTPNDLRLRYPAFAAVGDPVVQYWLDDAERIVTASWIDADYAPAILAYAAHNLALSGLEAGAVSGGSVGAMSAGLTSFRSASLSVGFSDSHAARLAAGEWSATRYGAEFLIFLRRNRSGPVVAIAAPPACGC